MTETEKLRAARRALRRIASTETFTSSLDLDRPSKVRSEAVIMELHARMRFAKESMETLDGEIEDDGTLPPGMTDEIPF